MKVGCFMLEIVLYIVVVLSASLLFQEAL